MPELEGFVLRPGLAGGSVGLVGGRCGGGSRLLRGPCRLFLTFVHRVTSLCCAVVAVAAVALEFAVAVLASRTFAAGAGGRDHLCLSPDHLVGHSNVFGRRRLGSDSLAAEDIDVRVQQSRSDSAHGVFVQGQGVGLGDDALARGGGRP